MVNKNKLKMDLKYMLRFLPDKIYLKLYYFLIFKKKLNLDNPQTLNEKLQWLKLNDRNPLYPTMVDKYEAKKYLEGIIGKEYIIPTLGIYDSFEEIDFDKLPNQFVIKCTHDSGGVVICKDKNSFDIKAAEKKINKCLKRKFYFIGREWPYKNVKPRIIIEEYLVDESGTELKDYKLFCFNGKAEYIEVDFNRTIQHKLNTYDFDWNPLNFCDKSPSDYNANIQKPIKLEKMRGLAEIIAKEIAFIRVDFYSIKDKIYIGELTLYPGSGFINFKPKEFDLQYGKLLDIGGIRNENIK